MDKDREKRIEAIFLSAARLAVEDRIAWLDAECGGDEGLRNEVETLLAAEERASAFFDRGSTERISPVAEKPGDTIGRYRLLEEIGEGGMGVVYMAGQTEPFVRKVALKILKPGLDTRQVVARFEAERQALALMDHPHIAKVVDGGATDSGRPYFVMELVRGVPVTEFCDENRLSTRERLELFIPVCQAVQHAHQKGVIHRDLKPGNVLVTSNDGVPHPMVIDFGVAKALGDKLTDKTLFTRYAQMIGTPAYMSPEQAEMSRKDVDTRSDIYSLGVMLYELLTGSTPFPEEQLREAGWGEMQRIISEDDPQRPSVRLSTLTKAQRTSLTDRRREEPHRIGGLLRQDLDWVGIKGLKKAGPRRYETATNLSTDIRRYLAGDILEAAPPSWTYQVNKFVRRHRGMVTAGSLVVLALVVGLSTALFGLRMADEEARRANRQADVATSVTDFLIQDLLEQADLTKAEAYTSPNRNVRLLEIVDRAEKKIDSSFEGKPLVEARIRKTIGSIYVGLGEADKAEKHLRAAVGIYDRELGPDDPATLEGNHMLAVLLLEARGAYEESEQLIRDVVERGATSIGPEHRNTLESQAVLAKVLFAQGEYNSAKNLAEKTISLLDNSVRNKPLVLSALDLKAKIHWERGESSKGLEMHREVYEERKSLLGEAHPQTLQSLFQLVFDIREVEKNYALAEELILDGLTASRPVFGERWPTSGLKSQLAALRGHQGLFKESLALRISNRENASEYAGPRHSETLVWKLYEGIHYTWCGNHEKAISTLEETISHYSESEVVPAHKKATLRWLANTYWKLGEYDKTIRLESEIVEFIEERWNGASSSLLDWHRNRLAGFHARRGDWNSAAVQIEQLEQADRMSPADASTASLLYELDGNRDRADEIFAAAWRRWDNEQSEPDRKRFAIGLCARLLSSGRERRELVTDSDWFRIVRLAKDAEVDDWSKTLSKMVGVIDGSALTEPSNTFDSTDSISNPSLESLLEFVRAGELWNHGQKARAKALLDTASERVANLVGTGELGRDWKTVLLPLLFMDSDEHPDLNAGGPDNIDVAFLNAIRERWSPAKLKIDETIQLARYRRWKDASDALKELPEINGYNASIALANIPLWSLKQSLIHLLAGDVPAYQDVSKMDGNFFRHPSTGLKFIALGDQETSLHKNAGIFVDPTVLAFQVYFAERHAPGWIPVLNGMELMAQGRPEQALVELVKGTSAFNLHCRCVALSAASIAAKAIGQIGTGGEYHDRALEVFERLKDSAHQDWGNQWFEYAFCELMLGRGKRRSI